MSSNSPLVPKLRFPDFRGTGGWAIPKLGSIGFFTGGGTPSKDKTDYWIGVNPWVSSSDVSEDGIHDISISRYISDEAVQATATKVVPANSILLVSRVGVGKLAISRTPICTSQDFTNFTPAKDNLVFLAYCIKSLKAKLLAFNQGMAIKGFTKDDVSNLGIPLPKLAEQQKIADCLSSLDELIAAQARKVDALKTHKKGLMQQLFPREGETQPRLRFPEFRDAGGWTPTELGSIASFSSGGTPSKENPDYWNGTIPWVSASSMYDVHVSKADHYVTPLAIGNGTRIAKKGALLILVRGSMLFKRVPICMAVVDVAFNQDVKALNIAPAFNNTFVIYQLLAKEDLIPINETGIGAGKIDLADLKEFGLLIPSKLEQSRIADCLSNFDTLITTATQELVTLKTHKKGLMQQLFPSAAAVEA